MRRTCSRRELLQLMSIGGVVFSTGLSGCAPETHPTVPKAGDPPRPAPPPAASPFYFVQVSDTHWGYSGPNNPEADVTLGHAVAAINAVEHKPDFVVFTGDLTHMTSDATVRRARMKEFKEIVGKLQVPAVRFLPGEHDASLDAGDAYREFFGETHYAFDHGGVHFIALDNVSDASGAIGDAQLDWLKSELAKIDPASPLVVFAHRPLFALAPEWEWATKDGDKAIELLSSHSHVTVFYGHIHQAHHHVTGNIHHHAARSLIFPTIAPGSAPKKAAVPWDAASPDHGIGFREVDVENGTFAWEDHAADGKRVDSGSDAS